MAGQRIALLLVLLCVVFAVVELLPGNAAQAVLGHEATAGDLAEREQALGLDRPLPVRFADWLGGLLTGDLGSTARGEPVAGVLGDKFPNTLLLGGLALLVTVLFGVALGCWWTARPGGVVERLLSPGSTMVIAIPEFVVATLLVLVFALWTGWLPAVTVPGAGGGPGTASMLVLPVLALSIPHIGWNTRVVRAALVDASEAPHVEAAVLDGLSTRRVLLRHVLPTALPTIATSFATTVGMVFGGAVVVETIFNYPGIGAVLASSVEDRDAPLIATVVALTGTTIMVVLLVADLLRLWSTRGRV